MPRNRRLDEGSSLGIRVLFVTGLVAYAFALQFTTADLASIDGYFHIRYSALLSAAGWRDFPPPFPWLPLTIRSPDRYFDHHMLFHLWLVPFARGDLILGAKLAAAIGAGVAFVCAYLFLLWRHVRRAEWWMIALLAGAPGFLYRMEMPRVQAWSVTFLLLVLALVLARRWAWLLPLAWLYTWLYDAFPFPGIICACAVLAHWLYHGEVKWQPLAYVGAGVTCGLLINPYLPNNVSFISRHYRATLLMDDAISMGAEWYPLPLLEWFGWSGLVALVVAIAALLYQHRDRIDVSQLTTAMVAMVFLALAWRSARFVEYCVPFVAIALAMTLHQSIDSFVRAITPRARRCLATALVVWLAGSTAVAAAQLRGRPPASRYRAASAWIAAHTAPGAMVFNAQWDAFPLLHFHNPAARYVIGLDPSYLAQRDQALYDRWRRISAGADGAPARSISEQFGAAIAITDRHGEAFIAAMDQDPRAERAYEDAESIVYRLRP